MSYTCKKCRQTLRLKGTDKAVATDTGGYADQWSLTEFPMPKAANDKGPRRAARTRKPRKATPAKKADGTWSPKAGSKGAAALEIYRNYPGLDDSLMLGHLETKMGIKKGNARQYLKLCKTAKVV